MNNFPERDWKQLRKIKDEILASACEKIFKKIESISEKRTGCEYNAYLDLWKVIQKEDNKIAEMFNDLKRSNALTNLISCRQYGFLSDENLDKFSQETQSLIKKLIEVQR